jgi:hypothetical protein
MAEPSKDELRDDAEELGIDTKGLTKPELEEAIAAKAPPTPPELGPVVPADGSPATFESVGSQTGVTPVEADEIPEAGR